MRELVINGDLMDLPPYRGQQVFPPGPSIARDVLNRLVTFGRPVSYVFGNHDIGVSGFRCLASQSLSCLQRVNLCYPDYRIDDHPESTILVAHGHFHDPALLLYLRDLNNFTYRHSKFRAFQWAMQRREPRNPDIAPPPGAIPPVTVPTGANAYYTAKAAQAPLPRPGMWLKLREFLWTRGSRLVAEPAEWWWWKMALKEMAEYLAHMRTKKVKPKPVLYQIYGHTHRADPRDAEVEDTVERFYINAGSWTESVDEGWYVDIDPHGKAWLHDWINEPASLQPLK